MVGCLSCFQLYAFVVVEANVIINDLLSLLEGQRFVLAKGFFFEVAEKILDRGIVPAIATPRHRRSNVILLGEDKIRLRSVLLPLVTVEDESISDLFFLFGLAQVLLYQGHGVLPSEFMSHDKVIE